MQKKIIISTFLQTLKLKLATQQRSFQMKKELVVLLLSFSATLYAADNQAGGQRGQRPPMDPKTKDAITSCESSTGMPARGSGTRPTREQHEAFKACLAAAGVQMPEHHHDGRGGNENNNSQNGGDSAPPPPPDQGSVGTGQ